MERTFQGNWIDIPVTYYLDSVGGRTDTFWIGNRIGVDRLGNIIRRFPVDIIEGIFHVTRTGTHECSIESPVEWLRFIDSCYSLECRNCGNEGWRAINRHQLPFREWMTSDDAINDQNHFTFDETKFSDPVICTVLDTLKQKTLIVDGLHRARSLTIVCDEGRAIMPRVTIVECFGARVDIIFPCDVHQLPLL